MIRGIAFLAAAIAAQAQDGVITGIVRDAITKAPLAAARVSIASGGFVAATVSDSSGGFRFERLTSDAYSVECGLAGYEARSPVSGVKARFGTEVRPLVLELMPIATIEGTVFDDEGKAMSGVVLTTANAAPATTDREGHFALTNLPPADYHIHVRVPLDVRKKTLRRDPDTGETFGYPDTAYYPGTADPQAAVRVAVAPGLQLRGLDVQLRRVRLVTASGRVLERSGGEPVADARVQLASSVNGVEEASFAVRTVDAQGAFRFDLLTPGSYALLVYRPDSKLALPYVQSFEVGKTGVDDLAIRVPPFQKLQFTVETGQDGVEWTGRLAFSLMSMQRGVAERRFDVTSRDFTMEELPPGNYSLRVRSEASQAGSSRKLVVGSLRQGAQDLLTEPLVIVESGNQPVAARLSAATGRLTVRVVEPDGVSRVRMVLVRNSQETRPGGAMVAYPADRDGTLTLRDLAPGEYGVALALDSPIFREAPPLQRVEVKADQTAVVELRAPSR